MSHVMIVEDNAPSRYLVDLPELPLVVLQGFNASIEKDVSRVLRLRGSLNARDILGATAPNQVRSQIAKHRARMG